jgi:hypothetical protein
MPRRRGGVSLASREGRLRRSDSRSPASALAIHLWAVCLLTPASRAAADTLSPARARSTSPCHPRGVSRESECWNKEGSSRCNLRQFTAWRSPPLLSRHVSTTCWHTTASRRQISTKDDLFSTVCGTIKHIDRNLDRQSAKEVLEYGMDH